MHSPFTRFLFSLRERLAFDPRLSTFDLRPATFDPRPRSATLDSSSHPHHSRGWILAIGSQGRRHKRPLLTTTLFPSSTLLIILTTLFQWLITINIQRQGASLQWKSSTMSSKTTPSSLVSKQHSQSHICVSYSFSDAYSPYTMSFVSARGVWRSCKEEGVFSFVVTTPRRTT